MAVLQIETVVSQPFAENSYIAYLEGHTNCLVVDPGLEPELIVKLLREKGLKPAAIINTHGHADHIGGNAALKAAWPNCPLVIGVRDAPKLIDPELNLSARHATPVVSPPADMLLTEGSTFSAAGIDLEVLEMPGHSVGHVVLVYRRASPWVVFGGDVLFEGSIGRTDFPDGSFDQLFRCIQEKLFTMPDDTIVLPGHGNPTRIGFEKQNNPFVGRRF